MISRSSFLFLGLFLASASSMATTKMIELPDDAKNVQISRSRIVQAATGKESKTVVCYRDDGPDNCRTEITPTLGRAAEFIVSYDSPSESHYEMDVTNQGAYYSTDHIEKAIYFDVSAAGSKPTLTVKTFHVQKSVIDVDKSIYCDYTADDNLVDPTCVAKMVYKKVPSQSEFAIVKFN